MRLLYVLPGRDAMAPEVVEWCRELLGRLLERDHHVEVLTTAGTGPPALAGAIAVHQLPIVQADRDLERLIGRCIDAGFTPRLELQEAWLAGRGPAVPTLVAWLRENGRDYDAVALVDGASQLTWWGLGAVAGFVPSVLHPLAADDERFRLGVFDTVLCRPTALALVDHREAMLVAPRAGKDPIVAVAASGVDVSSLRSLVAGDGAERGEQPYLLGGWTSAAGERLMLRYFSAYQQRHPGPLRLVLAGGGKGPPVREERLRLIAGAVAVLDPPGSRPLPPLWAEAGALGRPCLVATGGLGRLRPRPGALGFGDLVEFEAAVELLTNDPASGATLGCDGRRFVESSYRWDDLLARYERLLFVAQSHR